ncbi:hypothetical protein K2X85_06355 [bacterium]|nr:hypothetical protein [bacterium]
MALPIKTSSGPSLSLAEIADPLTSFAIFVFLVFLYTANGTFLFNVDTEVNAINAVQLVERQQLLFTPETSPEYYLWSIRGPTGSVPVSVELFDSSVNELKENGILEVTGESYVIRASRFPGHSINTFGWGVAVASAPIIAFLDPWLSNPETRREWIWRGGKLAASLFAAGSVVCIFLTARLYAGLASALLVALAYGIGTSVWSVSSQALWPHGPSEFFLSLGTYGLVRSRRDIPFAALSGFAYGWATCCRQPSAMAVISAGLFLMVTNFRAFFWFVLGGLPFAIAMFGINAWCYGSPFHFGELLVPELAKETTGNPSIWQTPIGLGLTSLLFSPSRGLFIYSPFLLFSLYGAILVWHEPRFRDLRPATITVALMWVVHAHYFDWWGGWSYGYRHIVDSTTFLALLLCPVLSWIRTSRIRVALFALSLGWSVFVQGIGAWAFDVSGWNGRKMIVRVDKHGHENFLRYLSVDEASRIENGLAPDEKIINLDIDRPENRHRLWSLTDHQIGYYIRHFKDSVECRRRANQYVSRSINDRRIETYRGLKNALNLAGLSPWAQKFALYDDDAIPAIESK